MDKFLEKYNLPKLNEEAQSLSSPITADEIQEVIKKFLTHKSSWPNAFTGEFYRAFKEELTPTFTDYSKKFKNMEDSQTLFKS